MDKTKIEEYLKNKHFNIDVKQKVTSTNTILKEMASNGEKEGAVLIALEQTAGRGRMNRKFYSPGNTGLYMSILLKPDMLASDSIFITTAAAVAVAKAIEEVSGKEAQIKWVNDVYIDGRKVSGILTEASFDCEGRIEYIVLGIGVNVFIPENDFDENIKDIATAVFENFTEGNDEREKLAACILNYFWEYYVSENRDMYMNEYRNRSFILGRKIEVLKNGKAHLATAIEIDINAKLLVEYENGERSWLNSGEISCRTALARATAHP